MATDRFKGVPYPIVKHPLGFLHVQSGINQIKSDLLFLLYSHFGERVMLPEYGIGLKNLFFEPSDAGTVLLARQIIADAIEAWEPRVVIEQIEVTLNTDNFVDTVDISDLNQENEHILGILIRFFDPENINQIEQLVLEVPLQ
jgi:phage baseplate assembly protein W